MAPSSVWPLIHGEREALAADLAGLTDEQWATASLCPGWSVQAMLGEAVVHGEDIRRPLGIKRIYPPEAVTRAANFLKGSNLLIGSKRRTAGLGLRANDLEWATESGPR
jgi:hypothetical protein